MAQFEGYVLLRMCDSPYEGTQEYGPSLSFVSAMIDKFGDKTVRYLVVRETGKDDDNPHFHAAFKLVGKMQALRQTIGRAGFKGNEDYSLKAGISDKMESHFRYLCKGKGTGQQDAPNVVLRHPDFDDAVVEELNKAFWAQGDKLRSKSKRKREVPAAQQILDICKQRGAPDAHLSEDEIIDIALDWYLANKWGINTFQVKATINWVQGHLNKETNRWHLLRESLKFKF